MERERTKFYDVIRQNSTISIVERRSGVATSILIPCDEVREAVVRILSEPIKVSTESQDTPKEEAAEKVPVETTTEQSAKKTTKKRTKKEGATT